MSSVESSDDQQPSDPLVQQVMERTKTAYETLTNLWHSQDHSHLGLLEHEHEDMKLLEAALGRFAAANLDEGLERVPELQLPNEVQEAANAITARILKNGLNWAIFNQYKKHEASAIGDLLANKTIVATSLSYGHGHSDGFGVESGTNGQRNNLTAVGKLLRVDPWMGQLWLGEPHDCYQVDLWGHSNDFEKRKEGVIEQQSELYIVDGLDFANPPRIGQLAAFEAELIANTS